MLDAAPCRILKRLEAASTLQRLRESFQNAIETMTPRAKMTQPAKMD
jgi:hypothetical protein